VAREAAWQTLFPLEKKRQKARMRKKHNREGGHKETFSQKRARAIPYGKENLP
jgi:hypothetical protein